MADMYLLTRFDSLRHLFAAKEEDVSRFNVSPTPDTEITCPTKKQRDKAERSFWDKTCDNGWNF